jgi:predicted nucleotidyltransferase component of viral defense system
MTLDYPKHKSILFQILKDIYSDTAIAPFLGFKGGTAALMFYGLNRDSVDLDFDLLNESKEQTVFERIGRIAAQYGVVVDSRIKRFNLVTVIAYDKKSPNIKIEVNRRNFGSRYEMKTILGISLLVMAQEDMFAHKLMAMHERVGKTSRDVFDVYFFAKNRWPINRKIVEERSGMPFRTLLGKCVEQLEAMNNRHILDGLGELLSEPQKDWAREKLRSEAVFLLKAMVEIEK